MSRAIKNAFSNLLGAVLPALVLLLTVPVLVKGLGEAQYGLLVILSSVTGYLAVLDINLTASSVKFLAEADARAQRERGAQVLSFSLAFYSLIGFAGAALLYLFAGQVVAWLVDPELYSLGNAKLVLQISALGFAFGQLYTFLLSIPQALQRYDVSAKIEIANGTLVPLATAGIVLLGFDLLGVSVLRNVASLLAVLVLCWVVKAMLPGLRFSWPDRALRKEMLSFSAFAYLNRLASLSYQHSDKIVIAAVLDVKQVAIYTIPVMLANRVMGTTFRLTQVIFPTSSALLAQGRVEEMRLLMTQSMRYVFALNAAAVTAVVLLGRWFLYHWLGPSFATAGISILVLVTLGALIDSLTNAPALVTDGAGRPKVTGIFAVGRAAAGLLALYVGAVVDGIRGVAASHLLTSCLFSALFLVYFTRYVTPMSLWKLIIATMLPGCLLGVGGFLVGYGIQWAWGDSTVAILASLAGAMLVMLTLAWAHVLTQEHRARLLSWGRSRWLST